MFCPKCGSQIAPGNKFCIVCGNPVRTNAANVQERIHILNEPDTVPEESPDTAYAPAETKPEKPSRPAKKKLSGGKKALIVISVIFIFIIGLGVTGFILVENSPAKEVVILLDKGKYERAAKLYEREVEGNIILDKLCQNMLTKQFDARLEEFSDGKMKYDEAIEYFSAILKMKVFDKYEITERMIDTICARCDSLQKGDMDDKAQEEYDALIEFGEDELDGFDRSCMAKPKPVEPKPPESTPKPAQKTEEPAIPTEKPTEEPVRAVTFEEGAGGWMVATGVPVYQNNPTEAKGHVVMGIGTEAAGDWAYAFNGYDIATDNAVCQLIDDYATVVTDQHGEYIINPTIVEAYKRDENPDIGDVTYTWRIRQDLVFNNGDPVKAENFVAWSLFTMSPAGTAMAAMNQGGINSIPGAYEYNVGVVNHLSGMHLLDDYTFSITTLKVGLDGNELLPYYYELAYFGTSARHIGYWFGEGWHVKDDGEGIYFRNDDPSVLFTKDNIEANFEAAQFYTGGYRMHITSGSYTLVAFDKTSKQVTLAANPNYNGNFEGRKPGIQQIVIKYVSDAAAVDALVNGEIDFYPAITSPDVISNAVEIIENGEFDGDYCQFYRAGYGYFEFACDFGPTQWKEFRQAVAYLIDRNEFADTFCKGWGSKIDGSYATAFKMYQDSKDWIDKNLDPYDYNPEKAVELLKEIGFVYNEDGTDYVDGSGLLRYKEVTAEEAKYYGDDNLGWNVTLDDGRILMPARINWCSSQANEVSELLAVMLADSVATKNAGIEIIKTEMDFPALLNWLYRQDTYGIGGADYSVPKYNMFNLATTWSAAVYDMSFNWIGDPEYLAAGYNELHLYDEELDHLSMDMVYGVEPGDYESYLNIWRQYIDRWNELLPQVPLYSNIYISIYPKTIEGYNEDSYWGFERAILYCNWIG